MTRTSKPLTNKATKPLTNSNNYYDQYELIKQKQKEELQKRTKQDELRRKKILQERMEYERRHGISSSQM